MKIINPQTEPVKTQRSFLFYGEPKAGKTSLSMSVAELGKTLFVAAEKDGWQDAYEALSPTAKKNIQVTEIETLQDVRELPAQIAQMKDVGAVVVDSFTALMGFIESEIKKLGGKHVVAGLTNKLALNSYGDLANLSISFLQALKATGKHIILTCGIDKEVIETGEGAIVRKMPLLVGGKTGHVLPYEMRAIGYLRNVNGRREVWFEASQEWLAGTNYASLTNARKVEDPTVTKLFTLFPKPTKNVKPPKSAKPSDAPADTTKSTDDNGNGPSIGEGQNGETTVHQSE